MFSAWFSNFVKNIYHLFFFRFPTADDKKMLSPQFVVTLEGLDTSKFPSRKRKMVSTSTPITAKESKSEISVSKIPEKHKHTPIVYNREDFEDDDSTKNERKRGKTRENVIDLTTLSDTSPILDKTIEDSDKEIMERVNDTVKIIINDKAIGEQRMQSNSGETKVKLKEIQCKYDHIPDGMYCHFLRITLILFVLMQKLSVQCQQYTSFKHYELN